MNLSEAADLTSIGTLFAFVLVCGGILKLQMDGNTHNPAFRVPYLNGGIWLPVLVVGFAIYLIANAFGIPGFSGAGPGADARAFYDFMTLNADPNQPPLEELYHSLPLFFFLLTTVVLTGYAIKHRLSLIPCLGLLSCLYLMSFVPIVSWIRFLGWLAVGLVIFFTYSHSHSKLNTDRLNG
jgi:hypothetical protein